MAAIERPDRLPEIANLPRDISPEQWMDEKARWQNPRIRVLLGCSALLENVQESNQAILSCSPARLVEIWAAVREVARLISVELMPLLVPESGIPALEAALQRTRFAVGMIRTTVIAEIERMPETIDEGRSREWRKLLCVACGQIDDCLQNAFAELMSGDPRGLSDAGYFLSRRFRRDVAEAEWLLSTVDSLVAQLAASGERRQRGVAVFVGALERGGTPSEWEFQTVALLLHDFIDELAPRLKEAASLRGIRYAELEVVERWASELPVKCEIVLELWDLLRSRPETMSDASSTETLVLGRIRQRLTEIEDLVKDLRAFLPLWRQGIGNRRALSFRRQ